MYLFRAPNCTYYTRICLPKSQRDRGFPFDIKISLLTKCRSQAVELNLKVAAGLKHLIESITSHTQLQDFRQAVDKLVNDVRLGFTKQSDVDVIPVRTASPCSPSITVPQTQPVVTLKAALAAFVVSKKVTSVRPLTIKQLEQRISHFIGATSKGAVAEITSAEALVYRDLLLTQGRSIKTNKEYLAACYQFFKWCRLMNHTSINPFEDMKIEQKMVQRPDEERERWQDKELKYLLSSSAYQEKGKQFHWITMLMLYAGLRPSEACQLRVADIQKQEGFDCIRVTNEGELQRVKTQNSLRVIPVHSALIEQGFLEYVVRRKAAKQSQLFDYYPDNQNEDWSRSYCQKLGKLQTKIGMKAGDRPTAYGFRHTFIDELKQKDASEAVVAQLVGHAHSGLTYGRYGKRLPLDKLVSCIESLQYEVVAI